MESVTSRLIGIDNSLNGVIGIDFHNKMCTVLHIFYKRKGYKFVPTKQLGGDHGTDGYVQEFNTYFAFTADSDPSLKKVQVKLRDDLENLLTNVHVRGAYTGKVEKFIFVFSTHGGMKPNDPYNKLPEIVNTIKAKYNVEFEYEIWNVKDVVDLINDERDINLLNLIVDSLFIYEFTLRPDAIQQIRVLLNAIDDYETVSTTQVYKRKSTDKKITDSDLEDLRSEFESVYSDTFFYTKLEVLISDTNYNEKFMIFRERVLDSYSVFSKSKKGHELFNAIVESVSNILLTSKIETKVLIMYLFDKCEIF